MSLDTSSPEYKKARRQHIKSTRKRDQNVEQGWTPFRAAEKRYKARFPPPDLSDVLDLATIDEARVDEVARLHWRGRADVIELKELSIKDASPKTMPRCEVYAIPQIPGLVILPSFVPPDEQVQLIQWSLRDQARYPNETNLDTHYNLPHDGLWNLSISNNNCEPIHPKHLESPASEKPSPLGGPRELITNTPASPDNFQELSTTRKAPPTPSTTAQLTSASALIPKLRWANIGWYYHWGTKQYDFTRGKGTIDPLLRGICKAAVESINWGDVFSDGEEGDWGKGGPDWMSWKETYEPDAGIVNFYQTKDTLMAHVDRSELCATSPLVSISLGNAAIFLIGGLTRDLAPLPILLRSGDVVIMSGPACRRAYHGVPRILENTLPSYLEGDEAETWLPYRDYMRTTRININVRQVFPKEFVPRLDGAL